MRVRVLFLTLETSLSVLASPAPRRSTLKSRSPPTYGPPSMTRHRLRGPVGVSTCTTPVSPISRLPSASYTTSEAPLTTACFFAAPLCQTSSSTLTLVGPVVPTLAGPLWVTRCSWATTSSPSHRSTRTSSPVRALRRSTVLWLTVWWRRAGFISCSWSCIAPYREPLWSTTATSTASTSLPTSFSTSTRSMLRLISISSASALPSRTFVFSMSQRLPNSPTSSPRGYPPQCSRSFGPDSTSVMARVSTSGGVRELIVIEAHGLCVFRVFDPVCGEGPTLDYILVLLFLESIKQPFSPPNTYNKRAAWSTYSSCLRWVRERVQPLWVLCM
jgi:hypothetical protein